MLVGIKDTIKFAKILLVINNPMQTYSASYRLAPRWALLSYRWPQVPCLHSRTPGRWSTNCWPATPRLPTARSSRRQATRPLAFPGRTRQRPSPSRSTWACTRPGTPWWRSRYGITLSIWSLSPSLISLYLISLSIWSLSLSLTVRRTQPSTKAKISSTTHVQLLQWLHGKQQQQQNI